jgi:cytochrome c-type biogenesis protein
VIDGHFAYAFTVGLLATVNPCGFAMLPAYLSFFLGLEAGQGAERRSDVATTTLRALAVGATVSLGFLVVFATIGTLLKVGLDSFIGYVQWATVVIGLGLVGLGVALVLGYHLPFSTPRLDKGGRARSFASVFVFGVSYGIASIGCAVPLFIAAVVGAVGRDGWVSGLLAFASYSAGMALVLTTLTLALAFARDSFVQALRTAMRYVDRAAGAFLVLAGGYLAYYWAFNKTTGYSTGRGSGPIRWVEERSEAAQQRIQDDWGYRNVGLVLGAVVLAAVVVVLVARQRQRRRQLA